MADSAAKSPNHHTCIIQNQGPSSLIARAWKVHARAHKPTTNQHQHTHTHTHTQGSTKLLQEDADALVHEVQVGTIASDEGPHATGSQAFPG